MKTVKKISLVVLMLVSTLNYAGTMKARSLAKVTMVEFINAKKGQQLLVKDSNGFILHSETIKNNGNLSKIFDLKQLKEGIYTVELEKDFEIIIKPFEIKNNGIVFFKEMEKKLFKPSIRLEDDKLLISQMNLESNAIEIKIYYEDVLVYSENIDGKQTMNRVFKLSDTKTGDYHTILKINERRFVKHFKL
ncbi:hypothetical protein [Psychroserpens sp.]|uniref:hypothetical protein n=1 Tax=Psychroserpens sp. TaxID=2020870 RepID=UPI003864BDA6